MEFTVTLKKNYEFRRLYSKGKSTATACLALYCRKNGSVRNRIGYTVSNKIASAAVCVRSIACMSRSLRGDMTSLWWLACGRTTPIITGWRPIS